MYHGRRSPLPGTEVFLALVYLPELVGTASFPNRLQGPLGSVHNETGFDPLQSETGGSSRTKDEACFMSDISFAIHLGRFSRSFAILRFFSSTWVVNISTYHRVQVQYSSRNQPKMNVPIHFLYIE